MKTVWIKLALVFFCGSAWAKDISNRQTVISEINSKIAPSNVRDPLRMVFVQGGTFQMGDSDEIMARPAHSVTVDSFKMQVCEVSRGEFNRVMDWALHNKRVEKKDDGTFTFFGTRTPLGWFRRHSYLPRKDTPCRVSWYGAAAYCNFRSEMEGLTPCYNMGMFRPWKCNRFANGYRLPTEAEWEYAARGGNKGQPTLYSGSDRFEEVGWFLENTPKMEQRLTFYDTEDCPNSSNCPGCNGCLKENVIWVQIEQNIGSRAPNELGIYDLSGNAEEWCNDWYAAYPSREQINPTGPTRGRTVVKRGGDYRVSSGRNRVFDRSGDSGGSGSGSGYRGKGSAGFRVVQSFPPEN